MRLALLPIPGSTATPPALRRMRIVATALLIAMAAVFFVARAMGDRHPAWGFVRAFAEAAMVGGLADWFAVTAL
ncbi:MAG: rane protein, partial [Sphingomonas bacterium]|nr:rane protein [Sphingomonas bacterium]